MTLLERYDFSVIVNDAVRLVIAEMETQLTTEEMNDEEYVMDIAALALNNLPPLYRATLLGKMYHDNIDGTEYDVKVKHAVSDALNRIRSNPY